MQVFDLGTVGMRDVGLQLKGILVTSQVCSIGNVFIMSVCLSARAITFDCVDIEI